MQTDPIGYSDGMNIYAYVGNDPVNGIDPTGLAKTCTGSRIKRSNSYDCNGMFAGTGPLPNSSGTVTVGFDATLRGGVGSRGGGGSGGPSSSVCANSSPDVILICGHVRHQASDRWQSIDFVNHYYFGNGAPVNLGDIGLGVIFESHPSVVGAIERLISELLKKKGNDQGGVFYAETTTNVTDAIFSVGGSSFFGKFSCQDGLCAFNFSIRDRFADPVNLGIEVGGVPYPINYNFGRQ